MMIEKETIVSTLTFDIVAASLYVCSMAVLGAFIVAMAQEISALAEQCNTRATALGTVFVANGVGSVLGSLLGSPFYRRLPKDITLGLSTFFTGVFCFGMPSVTSVLLLHGLYFLCGISVGLVDTGASILVNQLLGKASGPWLIAIQLAFNLGGAVCILLGEVFSLGLGIFYVVGVMNCLVGILIYCIPFARAHFAPKTSKVDYQQVELSSKPIKAIKQSHNLSNSKVLPVDYDPENVEDNRVKDFNDNEESSDKNKQQQDETLSNQQLKTPPTINDSNLMESDNKNTAMNRTLEPANYYSDMCIGLLILCIIGSGTAATAFLEPYAESTKIVSKRVVNLQICIVWVAMSVGILFSLLLRNYWFNRNEDIPRVFVAFALIAALGSALMIAIENKDDKVLWSGLVLFGFFSKPCVGFAFQWLTVVTYANETSFAIAYVGLNAGAGIIPFITTTIWNYLEGPNALFLVLLSCMLVSIPLFYLSEVLSCKERVVLEPKK